MAVRYVRSTDGNNADNGSTWALAKLDLAGVGAIDTAGDTIWVSQSHAESTNGAITPSITSGTAASPVWILCGNDAAEPPTVLATTATVTTTSSVGTIALNSVATWFYWYGISFIAASGGSGTASITMQGSTGVAVFESCNFRLETTGTGGFINGGATSGKMVWINCGVKFGAAAQGITFSAGGTNFINGGSLLSGGVSPTSLFLGSNNNTQLFVENFDLTNASASINLCAITGNGVNVVFRNCKLPASWSGLVFSGTIGGNCRYAAYNCDSGSTNYMLHIVDTFGTIDAETTIVRADGASDGTTSLSWKMASSSAVLYPIEPLKSDEFVVWNDVIGNITATVEYLHDTNVAAGQGAGASSAFQNNEIWLEVNYLSDSGSPLGACVSTAPNVVTAASDNATGVGTASWTTTGMTTPKSGRLAVTLTANQKGYIHARIFIGKASKTVYFDPLLKVT